MYNNLYFEVVRNNKLRMYNHVKQNNNLTVDLHSVEFKWSFSCKKF